ncbi:uncharacterized protein LOC110455426 [Mizuhopecten yessoensis]|uniref:uncharacterized protein LOC110455426 n=1 Tax=Mizuhopecten yessoensis TaxID=6573 RepID=UPI000B45883D|nr:uncharacterized protein LOC110455426 [Mizuhopecten yessoensis]
MDIKQETSPPSIDFSNNFNGVPNTPPVSAGNVEERPLFSIGVDPPQEPAVVDTKGSSAPFITNLKDVGGAHLTVEKKAGMNRSASSPSLSEFFSFVPGSKAISNVNIQVNVPRFSTDKSKGHDEGSSVDPEVKLPRQGISGTLITQEPPAKMLMTQEPPVKHIRKEMQTLYSKGEVNKFGSLFRKPGTDHKVLSVKKTESTPPEAPLTPFKEEIIQTPQVSLVQRVNQWITTSPVKHTDREINAFSPTSF